MAAFNYFERMFLIPEENEHFFDEDRKKLLNTVEKIGLEAVLCDFVKGYELETYGESYGNIAEYTRYNRNSVDILDGIHDTYIFDCFAIGSIWMTNEGDILLDCVNLSSRMTIGDPEEFDEEADDVERYEDAFEVVEHCDIWSDCPRALFRLD